LRKDCSLDIVASHFVLTDILEGWGSASTVAFCSNIRKPMRLVEGTQRTHSCAAARPQTGVAIFFLEL
jgi:hypothetical protein